MGEYSGSRAELPKNIRQIGERDEVVRLYVEDYVNTYLKQVYPSGGPGLRVALMLGNSDPQQEVPCLFVDGALDGGGADGGNDGAPGGKFVCI